jgi:hypothetical protein
MRDLDELEETPDTFVDRFVLLVCEFNFLLYIVLILELMLLLLSVLSALFADLDADTRTVLILDFVLLGGAITITVGGIALCQRSYN